MSSRGEQIAAQALVELNTDVPAGIPQATRVVDSDLLPEHALAIRVVMVREIRTKPMGGRVVALAQRQIGIECWAKADGVSAPDTLVDPLVEHVLAKLENSNLNKLAHFTDGSEIVFTYISRDGSWCRATVILPVQFHTKVGDPT